jgi:hypothetical protein
LLAFSAGMFCTGAVDFILLLVLLSATKMLQAVDLRTPRTQKWNISARKQKQ